MDCHNFLDLRRLIQSNMDQSLNMSTMPMPKQTRATSSIRGRRIKNIKNPRMNSASKYQGLRMFILLDVSACAAKLKSCTGTARGCNFIGLTF